jgi:hypothetical protein
MRSPRFLAALLVVALAGCTNSGSETANSEGLKLPPSEAAPTAKAAAVRSPSVPPQPPLIPPTDPRARLKQVPVGRSDPFAPTLGKLTVTRKIDEKAEAAALAARKASPSGSKLAASAKVVGPAVLPAPLSNQVYVAGVLSSGRGVTAIVQTPERPDGESVQVGSRIRQGRLTVAAIDAHGPVGVVWFREAGRSKALPRLVGQPQAADPQKAPDSQKASVGQSPQA